MTLAPFALVGVIALAITLAAVVATPPRGPIAEPSTAGGANATPRETAASPSAATPTAAPTATSARANDAAEMLRIHNELRTAIGAPAVRSDDRVTAAAQRHAEYLAKVGIVGHEETAGQPGFTGATVRDRLAAQGLADATASEVAANGGSGTDGVRYLWELPYHRLGLMHPHAVISGWGHAETGGFTATVGVIVFDFGSAAPDVVRSPAIDQRVPASWHGEESPEVLPAGASRPVGWPIMLVYSKARATDLRGGQLSDPSGEAVPFYLVPQIYERDYMAVVPTKPLAPGSRYRIRLDLTVGGAEVTEEWSFETER